ncbi:FUN14 domain-containing protein 1 [Hondaea fermentalgiana]|uniref:FUN14 domain-containing protein 1 n=1 Tax=Hondaea fermentalgiana TaxID=2315210 RepID=A0A2R5GHW3_9STRA|nr:FUN14 domain-containing protein 1 [Hondaea fermentalgiana]|eukprot:GBG30486.1 FUN14 domain-containing protein 1 [Hondaea fermentalgiana]
MAGYPEETRVVDVSEELESGVLDAVEAIDGEPSEVLLTKQDKALVDVISGTLGPVLTRLGFGGALGFCTGYAIKQASKVVATALGVGFVCLQGMQYAGYIEVRWDKIRGDLIKRVDTDGSGTVTTRDIKYYVTKVFGILKFHGPHAAGFSSGLVYGFRW